MAKGKLTNLEKAAILGLQLQGSTVEEIAEELQRPVETIKKNLMKQEVLDSLKDQDEKTEEEVKGREDKTLFAKEGENGRQRQAMVMTPAESSRSDGTRKSDHRELDFVFTIDENKRK